MDAMKKYFTYKIGAGCGISKIKLLGALEDWIKLRENIEKLREFGLDKWIDQLGPILDQFIRLYKGDIDEEFWGNIYRYQPSGGFYFKSQEYATGWITTFFPNTPSKNNQEKSQYSKVAPDELPTGLSQAPVQLVNLVTGKKLMDLEFCAGFFGVGLDEDGFLYPYQGWAIQEQVQKDFDN